MGRRSIGENLKRAKSCEAQKQVLDEWIKNWQDDQTDVIKTLRYAAMHDDHGKIMHMIQQLEGMTEKRFRGLSNIAKIVSDPERELKNEKVRRI